MNFKLTISFLILFLSIHSIVSAQKTDTMFIPDSLKIQSKISSTTEDADVNAQVEKTFCEAYQSINTEMHPHPDSVYSHLSLTVIPIGTRVIIDSQEVTPDSLKDYKLYSGKHTITLTHEKYREQFVKSIYFLPGIHYNLVAEMNRKDFVSIMNNCAIPGLRQIKTGSIIEGCAIIVGSISSIYFLSWSNVRYTRLLKEYKDVLAPYLRTSDEATAQLLGQDVSKKYSKLRPARQLTQYGLIALSAVVVYHVVDVLMNHYEGFHSLEPEVAEERSKLSTNLSLTDCTFNISLKMSF